MYELLVHEEIQKLIFWLSFDESYRDDRDGERAKDKDLPMKMPYLVSGYEADSAA